MIVPRKSGRRFRQEGRGIKKKMTPVEAVRRMRCEVRVEKKIEKNDSLG